MGLDELEPCFTNDAATVWLLDLAEAPGPADLELLGPGERRRLARYADQRDAERYGAAHVGLRRLVARYLGVEPAGQGVNSVTMENGLFAKSMRGFGFLKFSVAGISP